MKQRSADLHPGIRIHAIKVGGWVAGVVFAVGAVSMVAAKLPFARWFFLAALVGGIAVFFLIRLTHRSD